MEVDTGCPNLNFDGALHAIRMRCAQRLDGREQKWATRPLPLKNLCYHEHRRDERESP